MRIDIDEGHEGLVTSVDQIPVGTVVWSVYGHIKGNEPTKCTIIGEPKKTKSRYVKNHEFEWVRVQQDGDSTFASYVTIDHLSDRGIGDHKHNYNRWFLSEESANDYIAKCIEHGIRRN